MSHLSERPAAMRQHVLAYLQHRLSAALDEVKGSDAAAEKRREALRGTFRFPDLVDEGAKYIGQVQLATHLVKGIHPDAKVKSTTNVLAWPENLTSLLEVGTHVLGAHVNIDATGNGAVNKKVAELAALLVGVQFDGQSLLQLLKAGDTDVALALGYAVDEAAHTTAWLASIDAPLSPVPASHTKLKQLYWLVGNDTLREADFHLLAPLYPTSLVHHLHSTLQEDRFSTAAQVARQAKKEGVFHERPTHDYPQLAVQKLGGTKPQNISQLNSERLGQNFLLASLPPQWRSQNVAPLYRTDTLFQRFGRRPEVRQTLKALHTFLVSNPSQTVETRNTRDALANALLDEFLLFGAELRELPEGWSDHAECRLPDCEKVWLDSGALAADPVARPPQWADDLATRYAHWLNAALGTTDAMRMGDVEHAHWHHDLRDALAAYEWELNHAA
ncbi:MAG: type I-F CRISPR-associated protein Csy1 [Macromonas sp.]